ncbi:hypothetical protein DPEC_G00207530 [Dallia pectoralis]|uniref:Uncharacterized protein n=1 Tax=Dallia pectoralis TaxID=75939 RepID=A0ACC2G4N7_DALPE|nr:hypothetical protein DPEC_G00207530 [Dallia pectoralis]
MEECQTYRQYLPPGPPSVPAALASVSTLNRRPDTGSAKTGLSVKARPVVGYSTYLIREAGPHPENRPRTISCLG